MSGAIISGIIITGAAIYFSLRKSAGKGEELIETEEQQKQEEKKESDGERRYRLFREAESQGEDVCQECKSIKPRRCSNPSCGKCLMSYCCGRKGPDGTTLCVDCYTKEREEICREAEDEGENVCWECLTVNPILLECGHCNCNECAQCSECLICDEHNYSGLCWRCEEYRINNDD